MCDSFRGEAQFEVVESLPESGVDLILGNDLLRGEVVTAPVLTAMPSTDVQVGVDPETFPFCVVTRSMSRNDQNSREETIDSGRQKPHPVELHEPDGSETEDDIDLGDTVMESLEDINAVALETVDSQKLKQLQSEDPEIEKLKSLAVESFEEKGVCF
ncbi:hypothetical protein Pcinc_006178 [Petrolisthes cinctipes]|uniref:Uncharacterized protein n=1 Tax=Petrolisthes cinctipes TaxID=88211 RepID=A0AAE1KZU5_PETCI|nr:hypothetical protein Pcinc_006178 [Petrolisthes cinctipes]